MFPVGGRVINISMYNTSTDDELDSLSVTFAVGSTHPPTRSSKPHYFLGYGVKVLFYLGANGVQLLDFRVPTSNLRDRFRSTLKQVRADILNAPDGTVGTVRMSHSRRSESRLKTRTEPEESSLSSGGSSCGQQTGSAGGSKLRRKVTKKQKLVISDDQLNVLPSQDVEEIKDKFFGNVKTLSAPNLTALDIAEISVEVSRDCKSGKGSEFLSVQSEVFWSNDVCTVAANIVANVIEQVALRESVMVMPESVNLTAEAIVDPETVNLTAEAIDDPEIVNLTAEVIVNPGELLDVNTSVAYNNATGDRAFDVETDCSSEYSSKVATADVEIPVVHDLNEDLDEDVSCCEAIETPDNVSVTDQLSRDIRAFSTMNFSNIQENTFSAQTLQGISDTFVDRNLTDLNDFRPTTVFITDSFSREHSGASAFMPI